MLSTAQQATIAAALRAETDAGVIAALAIRNDVALQTWCNSASITDAWADSMSKRDLFEATNITKFDNLTNGNRDAWKLLLDNAPIDMTRIKMRNSVEGIWGSADAVVVLQACTRKATRGEVYLGGNSVTTDTVSALRLSVPGALSVFDISDALNRNP